jgi:hypothetical protein
MKLNKLMTIAAAATLLAACDGNGGGGTDPNVNPLEVNKAGVLAASETGAEILSTFLTVV